MPNRTLHVPKFTTLEQQAQHEVEITASELGARLLRNNVGACMTDDGRMIRFGLGNTSKRINDFTKSSDLIGITKVTITPEMVGKTVGVFTAIEVKPPSFKIRDKYPEKSRERAQSNFHNFVRQFGGFAGFARNADDLKHIMNHFMEWLKS